MQLVESASDLIETEGVFEPDLVYDRICRLRGYNKFWYCLRSRENLDELIQILRSPLQVFPFRISHNASCECLVLYDHTRDGIPAVESYLHLTFTKQPLEELEDVLDLKKSFEECSDFEKRVWLNVALPVAHAAARCPVGYEIIHPNPVFKDPHALLKLSHPEMFYDTFRAFIDEQIVLTDEIMRHR